MTFVSRDFSMKELRCSCEKCKPKINKEFIEKLQKIRDLCGWKMHPSSWYRCEKYNKEIGGAEKSMHLHGRAVDIVWKHWLPKHKHKFVKTALSLGMNGIGISRDFCHIDDRKEDRQSLWTY